ncbi:MAG TPA: branched-chain amino acid ABC transporter substrate-binding protein [Candidatus Paceibacterota bacterium]|nr:branched-chain amino acid ABC transporter substrate-binding protein [Candidatus Paceibacterota bacterium]
MQPDEQKVVTVAASIPHTASQAKGQIRALKLALSEVENKAGEYNVRLLDLDDSAGDSWSADLEEANAVSAAKRTDVVAYYGPFNSGAAKISMPILNRARMLQVSGTVTWPGLTKPGYAAGEPMRFYPTGDRHFYRVAPTDALQGPAGALFLHSIGIRSVVILNDGGVFGAGASRLFESKVRDTGIEVLMSGAFQVERITPMLIKDIVTLNPDAVYAGADDTVGLADLYVGLRDAGYTGVFLGPEFRGTDFEKMIVQGDRNVYTTSPGVAARNQKNIKAAQFLQLYSTVYHEEPDAYALAAYESMRLILQAIAQSDGTRAGVLASFRNIKDFDSAFGVVNFDTRGDIELNMISIFNYANGNWEFVRLIQDNL